MSYTPTVWQTGDIVSSAKLNKIETELVALDTDKANIDGYYESMTVGNAEQLVATVGVNDKVPFNFRTTGGSADVGDRKTMEIVGGTVAWNQLCAAGNFAASTGWNAQDSTFSISDNIGSFTATATNGKISSTTRITNNHIYLAMAQVKASTTDVRMDWWTKSKYVSTVGTFATVATIDKIAYEGTQINYPRFIDGRSSGWDEVQVKQAMAFDLTQMFGATIADYIYSLETANEGAGVAWFKKLFPKPYYAYNAGELMSVKTSAYKSVGFNQLDKSTGTDNKYINSTTGTETAMNGAWHSDYISVVPNTNYYTNADGTGYEYPVIAYDADKNFLGKIGGAKPLVFNTGNAHYLIINTIKSLTAVDDLVLNLHWDGERDGEYEPYEAHTYALDSDLELRGIPKLDTDNQLYYDGDIYESNGDVRRRFGKVDLGTLNWLLLSADKHLFYAYVADIKENTSASAIPNLLSGRYETVSASGVFNAYQDFTIGQGIDGIVGAKYVMAVNTAYSDATSFKTAMSGVQLVYELATPEEETADPFQTPQIVNDFGTEEFVDARTIPIPVGHNSKYQANLRAKLEMAPNSPSGDGDYIVRQAGGQNSYVPITFPANELPAAPTTDGNYVLKCTVSSGTATFTWEAQT